MHFFWANLVLLASAVAAVPRAAGPAPAGAPPGPAKPGPAPPAPAPIVQLQQSEAQGGEGGKPFDDGDAIRAVLWQKPVLESFFIKGGDRLDSIGAKLSIGNDFKYGGSGGPNRYELKMDHAKGEYWASSRICWKSRVNFIHVWTNYSKAVGGNEAQVGTDNRGQCTTYAAPPGFGIGGFYGRGDANIDRLGFYYIPLV